MNASTAGVLAHGVGGRQDLPVPFSLALTGAVIALVVSFLALAFLWRTPRLRGAEGGRPLPAPIAAVIDSAPFAWALRIAGLIVAAWIGVAALFGPDDALNPTAGFVYVLLWVGICAVASALLGPVYRAVNPLRTLHLLLSRAVGRDPDEGLATIPNWLGRWPGALTLLAFLWLELAAPDRATLPVLRIWFGLYIGITFLLAVVFGARWFDRGDAFEVYSTLIARVAPFGRRNDGALVVRNPLNGLEGTPTLRGDAAVVVVLLGGTAFDGLSNAPTWLRFAQGEAIGPVAAATLGLAGCVALVGVIYFSCAVAAARIGGRPDLNGPRQFAASIVPIVLGYAVAHYYSLLVIVGQQTLQHMSDPLGRGDDLLGIAGRGVSYTWVQPTTVAVIQVAAVVAGHVAGVFAAHERSVRLFPHKRAVAGQVPLLIAMVIFTLTGLSLLFAG